MLTFRTGRLRNKLKEKDQATFYSPTDEWTLLAPSTIKPEGGKRVCGGFRREHAQGEQEKLELSRNTVRISKSPTTVVTANGEVQTKEEATLYVREVEKLVTVMLLEDAPAVLSLGKLCEDHGFY